jgi:RNA polymerase sigma factor (sigma-70 family)
MGRRKQATGSLPEMIEKKAAIVDAIADYGDRLMGLLVSLSGNMHDAKDIYQETWLKVFMSPRFDAEQIKKGTLVFVSAKRLFIDQYRKNKSETQKRGALAELVFNPKSLQSPVSQDASTRSEEIELKKRFWAGYPDLDLAEEKKEVHWLHARYGFTFLEIEEITGVSSSTACDWVSQSRKALKEAINQENEKIEKL